MVIWGLSFGLSLFVILYNLGFVVARVGILNRIFVFVGGISYQIFLVHHVLISKVFEIYNPTNTMMYWEVLGCTILLIIL